MFLACMANEQLYIFGDSQNLLLFYQKLLQDIMKKRIFKVTFFSISILFISCSLIEKYQGTDKKFETEVSKLEALREYEDKKDYILFVGSSSIRRWDKLAENMQPYDAVKRGYGGAHFYDLIHFTERLVAPHKNARAMVCFVANDITGKDNDLTPREVKNLFKLFTRQVHSLFPMLPIFFIEITPTPKRWQVWDQTSTVNELIQNYTNKTQNIHFISTRDQFIGKNRLPVSEYFVKDSLHLSQKGYDKWAEIIKSKLDYTLN